MDDPTTGSPFYPSAAQPAAPELDGLDVRAQMDMDMADSPRENTPRAEVHDYGALCDSLSHIVASSDPGRFAGAQPDQLARESALPLPHLPSHPPSH